MEHIFSSFGMFLWNSTPEWEGLQNHDRDVATSCRCAHTPERSGPVTVPSILICRARVNVHIIPVPDIGCNWHQSTCLSNRLKQEVWRSYLLCPSFPECPESLCQEPDEPWHSNTPGITVKSQVCFFTAFRLALSYFYIQNIFNNSCPFTRIIQIFSFTCNPFV